MISKSAIYWALGLGVAVAAAASPFAVKELPASWGGAAPPAPAQPLASNPAASPGPVAATGTSAAETPAPAATPKSPQPDQAAAPSADPNQAAADKTAAAPGEDGRQRPAFDVVRVEPTGDAVIAGRASPHASVQLRSDGQVVAQTNADESGQFAFLPPPFPAGGHRLQLAARNEDASEILSDAVGIDVPVTALATAPSPPAAMGAGPAALVAKRRIDEPARLTVTPYPLAKLKPPAAQGKGADMRVASTGPIGGAAPRVSVSSVDTNGDGGLEAKGVADPNTVVRLYLNNAFLAEATAGADGRWSLRVERGMKPGGYAIRADQIDGATGGVSARAEVPFNYPDHATSPLVAMANPQTGNGAPTPSKPSAPPTAAATPAAQAGAAPARTEPSTINGSASSAPVAPTPHVSTSVMNPQPSAPQPGAPGSQSAKPEPSSPAVAAMQSGAPQQKTADAVVAEVRTAKVVPGDNLWDLSQHFYGWGPHYRTIYEANATQIRDPALIYPDQIFVVPQTPSE